MNQLYSIFNTSNSLSLTSTTFNVFDQSNAPLLAAFYGVRTVDKLTKNMVKPNKGDASNVYTGELDKKNQGCFSPEISI